MKIMDLRAVAPRRAGGIPLSGLRSLAVALLAAAVLSGCVAHDAPAGQQVFIVRHAEKADGPDPALTDAGHARAEALSALLEDKGIERIFSTDTLRTRSTALPLARRLGIELELYDHREPGKLAEAVRDSGRNTLIVGHSNTIAGLAEAFGAEPGETVGDDEYDRLYLVRVADPAASEIRRYGD